MKYWCVVKNWPAEKRQEIVGIFLNEDDARDRARGLIGTDGALISLATSDTLPLLSHAEIKPWPPKDNA